MGWPPFKPFSTAPRTKPRGGSRDARRRAPPPYPRLLAADPLLRSMWADGQQMARSPWARGLSRQPADCRREGGENVMRKRGARKPMFPPGLWHTGLTRFLMRRKTMRPDSLMRPWNRPMSVRAPIEERRGSREHI